MRHKPYTRYALAFSALCMPAAPVFGQSETNSLNHFHFNSRAAFNITARFKQSGSIALSPNGRTTPNGNAYNYDDGYVLTDVSGNQGGQTWNWGYDGSSQISGGTVQMHQNTVAQNVSSSASSDLPDPGLGGEVSYDREFGSWHGFHYGLESAISYMSVSVKATGSGSGDLTQTTDSYALGSGTPPSAPYQGTFNGPGFLIGASPASSSTTTTAGAATIVNHQEISADVWGLRIGPYLELPVEEGVDLSLSVGLSMAVLDATESWSETVNISGNSLSASGGGSNMSLQYGGYAAANLSWRLSRHWEIDAGLQYQYLNTYEHSFGATEVQLDLRKSIFVLWGVSYSF